MGPRIHILKSIGTQIIFNSHWLLKDENAIDKRGRFQSFHGTRGTSSKKGHGRLTKCVDGVCFLRSRGHRNKKEVNECVREELILMCEKMLFMRKICANKEHGRKLCVANSCSGVHGKIFMNKPLDSYLK